MRNFFQKATSNGSDENSSIASRLASNFLQSKSPSANNSNSNRSSIGTSNNNKQTVSSNNTQDNTHIMIYCAAQCLSNTTEEILNDTSNLTGDNLIGFQKLLDILNSEDLTDDYAQLATSGGVGCLQYLISNMEHSLFIDMCHKASLPTSLLQGLRLLRMLEIKKSKLDLSTSDVLQDNLSTIKASKRLCKVMIYLCSDMKTVENVRHMLVKLLTFPLGVLPLAALHIQDNSANIISQICKTGFTLQQVWFLHDIQAMSHMVRQLSELTSLIEQAPPPSTISPLSNSSSMKNPINLSPTITTSNRKSLTKRNEIYGSDEDQSNEEVNSSSSLNESFQNPSRLSLAITATSPTTTTTTTTNTMTQSESNADKLLRSHAAEHAGMWITGTKCIVEIIATTLSLTPVLLSDFEIAGGCALFIHILKFSSPNRFILVINVIMQLLFDPEKGMDENIVSTTAGTILLDLLLDILSLTSSLNNNQELDYMVQLSTTILKNKQKLLSYEYIIQSASYSLLTIYSNNPKNCSILEDEFHFLPLLILSLPSLEQTDTVTAVLTVFNFLCLCVESSSGLSIKALCSSACMIINHLLLLINNNNDTSINNNNNNNNDKIVNNNNDNDNNTSIDTNNDNNNDKVADNNNKIEENTHIFSVQELLNAEKILDLIFQAIENIIRTNPKYAIIVLQNGLLRNVIYDPFVLLCDRISRGYEMNPHSISLYTKILMILLAIIDKTNQAADEIRDCGLNLFIQSIIASNYISPEFTRTLLKLTTHLALIDKSHLAESLKTIFTTILMVKDNFGKLWHLTDCLYVILIENKSAAEWCYTMNGLESTIAIILAMENKFTLSNISINELEEQALLRSLYSVMRVISLQISLSTPYDPIKLNTPDNIAFKKYYHEIIDGLTLSCLFTSKKYVEEGLEILFQLLTGFTDTLICFNAGTIEIVIGLMETFDSELLQLSLVKLYSYVEINIINRKVLIESGMMVYLIERFYKLFHGNRDLEKPLFKLFHLLKEYMTIESFNALFKYIIRPMILPNDTDFRLIYPWESSMIKKKQEEDQLVEVNTYESWSVLDDLILNIATTCDSVPHIQLDTYKETKKSSYINITFNPFSLNPGSKIFPQSGFTTSCWLKIDHITNNKEVNNDIIPILSIRNNLKETLLEVHVDIDALLIRVLMISKTGQVSTLIFKPIIPFDLKEWTLIVLTFKKTKKLASSTQASIHIFINGLATIAINNKDSLSIDSNLFNSDIDVQVGKMNVLPSKSYNFDVVTTWCLGPFYLFEDVLIQEQVSYIFLKGPKYTGNYISECLFSDDINTISCDLLHRCSGYQKPADQYLELLGYKDLDIYAIDIEGSERNYKFEKPSMPTAILQLSALHIHKSKCSLINTNHNIHDHKKLLQIDNQSHVKFHPSVVSLVNTSNVESKPIQATLENITYISNSFAITECISSIGGPGVLFPMLHAASTEKQICQTITILRYCIRNNISNLSYMQRIGYKILGFILSIKPSNIITVPVITSLLELSINKSIDHTKYSIDVFYLVDQSAFTYLILNHQIWSSKRFNITSSIISKLVNLVEDEKYSYQNAKRLSELRTTKWCLSLSLYCINLLDIINNNQKLTINPVEQQPRKTRGSKIVQSWEEDTEEYCNVSETWLFGYPSVNEMAEWRDQRDPFLSNIIHLLQKIISVDIQIRDIRMISHMILYTFTSDTIKSQHQTNNINNNNISRNINTQDNNDNTTTSLETTTETSLNEESRYPFCNYGLPLQQILDQLETNDNNIDNQELFTPLSVYRLYLLKLLFRIYDNYIEEMRRSVMSQNNNSDNKKTNISLNTGKDVFEIFRKFCSTSWFLSILEQKYIDIATKSHCLRLLVLFLQKDTIFLKEFYTSNGFIILQNIFQSEVQDLPIVLPIIAMLFHIPIQDMMHPFQIKSISSFIELFNLDECHGPDLSEPILKEVTIPLLNILLECLTTACKASNTELVTYSQSFYPMIDLILGVIRYTMEKINSFRILLEKRESIEILCSAMLGCSNAFNDYGGHVFNNLQQSGDDLSPDLTSIIQEDYIPMHFPGQQLIDRVLNMSPNEKKRLSTFRIINNTETVNIHHEVIMIKNYGSNILDIISNSINHSIMSLENNQVLACYFLAYPESYAPSYQYGFQMLIVQIFCDVIEKLVMKKFEPVLIFHIVDMIANLVPLLKANLLFDTVVFKIFQLTLMLAKKSLDARLSNSHDRVKNVIKELGNTSRYLAFVCTFRSTHEISNIATYITIRENLSFLFHASLEDVGDVAAASVTSKLSLRAIGVDLSATTSTSVSVLGSGSGSGSSSSHMSGHTAILDAIQVLGTTNSLTTHSKKSSITSIASMKAERNRIGMVFWVYLIHTCYGLVLEDDSAIRIEATRIISYLAIHRGVLMETLLGNNPLLAMSPSYPMHLWGTKQIESAEEAAVKASKELDLFRDGFSKLVPNASGKYELFIRGGTDDNYSEENRFADFSFWISDNSIKCDARFKLIDNAMHWIVASAADIEEITRQMENIFGYSSNYSTNNTSSSSNNNNISTSSGSTRDSVTLHNITTITDRYQRETYTHTMAAKQRHERFEDAIKQGNHIISIQQRFETYGILNLATGAFSWGSVWNTSQCCPFWGYMPIKSMRNNKEYENNPQDLREKYYVCDYNDSELCSLYDYNNDDIEVMKTKYQKSWYLNFSEGPERVRRKLEQDYSIPLPVIKTKYNNSNSTINSPYSPNSSSMKSQHLEPSSPNILSIITTITNTTSSISMKENDTNIDKQEAGMEDFLKKLSKEGILKKSTHSKDFFNAINTDDDEYLLLNESNDTKKQLNGDDIDEDEDEEEDGEVSDKTNQVIHKSLSGLRLEVSQQSLDLSPTTILGDDDNDDYLQEEEEEEAEEERHRCTSTSPTIEDIEETLLPYHTNTTTTNLSNDLSILDDKIQVVQQVHHIKSVAEIRREIELDRIRRSSMLIEVVKGLIGATEWTEGSVYNVRRIYGLEAHIAMLVLTPRNIHILCGFIVLKPKHHKHKSSSSTTANTGIVREHVLEWISPLQQQEQFHNGTKRIASTTNSIHYKSDDREWIEEIFKELLRSDLGYSRFPLSEVYSFFRRRHELKYTAMEVTDVKGYSALYSCDSIEENEQILVKLLQSDLPSSIFNSVMGQNQMQLLRSISSNVSSNVTSNVYNRLVYLFINKVTHMWQHGELSNFEYLMHINAAAGRSFQDLTQYPIFPWVIADYHSDTLDLNNPKTFRDLSKPMGALGARREQQYRDRYQTMDEFYRDGIDGAAPPFYYGTHYSCAGYVLHYLLRLQPYADMSVALQGGHFDKPDRLFLSVENSWISASQENLQDVRELIPEFFYLPEFLSNLNNFELGTTQKDAVVQDVILPKWAHNDPKEFIRIQREALESKYVSQNLHHWIDLIFGYKQLGKAAIDAMNVFIHLTYEGEVDIDEIKDPVMKAATISQINNFGQTPTCVFNKPHPMKIVPEVLKKSNQQSTSSSEVIPIVDMNALTWHSHLSPPLSVVGAPYYNSLAKISYSQVSYFGGSQKGLPVGDIKLMSRDRIIATSLGSVFILPLCKRIITIGEVSGGICIQSMQTIVGTSLDHEKELTFYENFHQKTITCIAIAKSGGYFATGSEDTSVRVWQIVKHHHKRHVNHICTLAGHSASIQCIDISAEYSIVVSGGLDNIVCVWDYRLKRMLRILSDHKGPVISVSISCVSGFIATLTTEQLRLYSINGELISYVNPSQPSNNRISGTGILNMPTVVLATPCGLWQDGVVLITGHKGGYFYLWKLRKPIIDYSLSEDDNNESFNVNNTKNVNVNRKIHSYITVKNESKSRELYISSIPTKTHKANITVLKLCSTATSKVKEIVTKSFEDSHSLDLLVGDEDGYVSRWAPIKLEQLPGTDLIQVLSEYNEK